MPQDTPVPEVEAAIAQVLAAEREALAAIEAARAEGGEILLRAHAEARRIAERGERRLGRLREAVARRMREEAERSEADIARLAAAPIETPADEAAVAAAVAAVAAELIEAEPTGSRAPQEYFFRSAAPPLQGAAANNRHPLPREGGWGEGT